MNNCGVNAIGPYLDDWSSPPVKHELITLSRGSRCIRVYVAIRFIVASLVSRRSFGVTLTGILKNPGGYSSLICCSGICYGALFDKYLVNDLSWSTPIFCTCGSTWYIKRRDMSNNSYSTCMLVLIIECY